MTISIWLIFILIAGVGFWFYYKKNRFKTKQTPIQEIKKEKKYSLTNIDQLLTHVSKKEGSQGDVNQDQESLNQKKELPVENEQESATADKEQLDIKNGIIASIILKKKDEI